ncbi:Apolipoprotein L domain-containing protein 1 [Anabarilius grahami]|uniref:Apolipoprotein L domain-containing protein 1 n=1 Tax=Anabarilius grahami TaxID=495550 RepID=A0A3N0Y2Q0_ANAGA|nr:Apolipoprotein L domain-containing protein 1 [Anabarilius grahami]
MRLYLQDYNVEMVEEANSVLPNVTGQSNGIHQTPPFSDFNVDSNPFAAPDWVEFPPPDFYKDYTPDVFQTTSASGIWGEETDIFQPFKEKVDTDVTQSSSSNQNTESSSSSNQRDPLLEFILSRQKKFQATPSFTSASDPADVFQETSTKTDSLFETPYVSNTDPVFDDIFKTPSSTAGTSDIKAFDPLFDPHNEVQSDRNSNYDLLLTGQDTKQDVRMSHVGLQNGDVQEILSSNTSNGDLNTTAEVENDLSVYEDVLLIGQERCVEDWPEDSPELLPEWKPAGKLRLRRDSIRVAETSDGVEGIAKKNGKQTLGKKLRHSLLIRRSSKLIVDGTEEFFTLDEEQNEAGEIKSDDLKSSSKTADLTALGEKKDEDVDCKPKIAEIETHPDDDDRNTEGINGSADGQKHKKKVKVKFVPQRGFVIGLSKAADLEKDGYKAADLFTSSDFSEKHQEMQDCRPKKAGKFKVPRLHRRQSKSIEESEIRTTKDYDEMKKPPILKVPPLSRRDSKSVEEDEVPQKGADLFKARDAELAEDVGWEEYTPDNKPQKPKETDSGRRGSKDTFPEDFLDSPGATSGDYHLSDAAKAEWMSAQMDMRRLRDQEEEQKREEEEDEGDTDSLMEWWNTVEFWDELPLNETINSKEEETISFKAVADKVHRGLRVYLKLFMERAELLYQHVLILYGIADDISNFHHRTKIANITGGTTTAVGGAAAIAGLALIPVTFGASIIISAIGLGVATAGGITAASASISDNIHNMHDRKKIEIIIQDYEAQLVEMQRCLRFIIEGLCRLRVHPLLRHNNYYTGDWEVRRALQTISLVTDPVERAEEITNNTLAKLAGLHTGIDKYFTKDMKEVKKGCKKEVTAEVRSLAKQLHEGLVELNSIREQLLDASGNI